MVIFHSFWYVYQRINILTQTPDIHSDYPPVTACATFEACALLLRKPAENGCNKVIPCGYLT